jgi:hypothetical protein
MKVLFLDGIGDHNLSVIDPQYPLFVLGGAVVDLNYAKDPDTLTHSKYHTLIKRRSKIPWSLKTGRTPLPSE